MRLAPLCRRAAALVVCALPGAIAAQAPPSTDIYLARIATRDGVLTFGTPINATHRPGYDNQPSFLPNGRAFLFTSVGDDAQADIWRYDLATAKVRRVTDTRESEYSPTVMPDGVNFSAVRVEADSTQRLWRFPLDGRGDPTVLLADVKPVGYHAWDGDYTLVLYVLGSPNSLQVADTRTGRAEKVAANVGRSLHRIPGTNLVSFVQKETDSTGWVKTIDALTGRIDSLVATLTGAEDLTWLDGETALMAKGSVLYAFHRTGGTAWTRVADFGGAGLRNITRLAVSPRGDWLALVAADEPARR
jgi:WD40-like Beta Propeller Repeat